MTSKLLTVAAAALVALTSAASALTLDPANSDKDAQLRRQAFKVAPVEAPVVAANPAIDPAYSQRDAQLRAQAEKGAIVTTHGAGPAYTAHVPSYDFALGSN